MPSLSPRLIAIFIFPMKFHRIFAILYRYYALTKRSFYRASEIFYWPAFEIILWGITSIYIQKFSLDNNILLILLSGVIFWLIIRRVQNDLSVCILEDIWNKNLINIFVSPLKFSEWTAALLIFSILKMAVVLVFSSVLALLLYQFNIFSYGFLLLPFVMLMLMTGWWIGFLVNSLILRYGGKVGTVAWSAIMLISPFSAIYYPVSILPSWAQKIALAVPTSYLFEGAREVLNTGTLDYSKIYMSFLLNTLYILVSLWILKASFRKMLDKGLAKMY